MARRTRIGRVAGLLSGSPTLANLWGILPRCIATANSSVSNVRFNSTVGMRHELTFDEMRRLVAACAGALRAPESVPGNVL